MNPFEHLPDGAEVTLTAAQWSELLRRVGGAAVESEAPPGPTTPMTVAEVAERIGRSESTVRGWLGSGRLDGFKMDGREWRVRPEALDAFFARQEEAHQGGEEADPDEVDLDAWRDELDAA